MRRPRPPALYSDTLLGAQVRQHGRGEQPRALRVRHVREVHGELGRTARAGRNGVAVTLITPSEILKLRDVERHARTTIKPASLDDFPLVPEALEA